MLAKGALAVFALLALFGCAFSEDLLAYTPINSIRLVEGNRDLYDGSQKYNTHHICAANRPVGVASGCVISQKKAVAIHGTLRVTAAPVDDGFMTVFPSGDSVPLASTVNYVADLKNKKGEITATFFAQSSFIVGLGPDQSFRVYTHQPVKYDIDIHGFYAKASELWTPASGIGSWLHPLPKPDRIWDSRGEAGARYSTPIASSKGSATIDFSKLAPSADLAIPADAYAISMTAALQSTEMGGNSALGIRSAKYPNADRQPWFGWTNPGELIEMSAVLGTNAWKDKSSSLEFAMTTAELNNTGKYGVILDVDGYFHPSESGALGLQPLTTPVRLFDTRNDGGSFQGSREYDLCKGQAGHVAVVTVTYLSDSRSQGFATMYPAGTPTMPTISQAQYRADGKPSALCLMLTCGVGGKVIFYNQKKAHVIVDRMGMFVPIGANVTYAGVTKAALVSNAEPVATTPAATTKVVTTAAGTTQAAASSAAPAATADLKGRPANEPVDQPADEPLSDWDWSDEVEEKPTSKPAPPSQQPSRVVETARPTASTSARPASTPSRFPTRTREIPTRGKGGQLIPTRGKGKPVNRADVSSSSSSSSSSHFSPAIVAAIVIAAVVVGLILLAALVVVLKSRHIDQTVNYRNFTI